MAITTIATQADLVAWCGINGTAELIALTDPNNVAIDTAVVASKLGEADAEIYARLANIDPPLTAPYPKLLINVACKIARYVLYVSGRPEWVSEDYRDAIRLLDAIRDGKASLGLDGSGVGPVAEAGYAVSFAGDARVFGREAAEGF